MKLILILLTLNLNAIILFGQKKTTVKSDFYIEIKYLNEKGIEDGAYIMETKKREDINIRKI